MNYTIKDITVTLDIKVYNTSITTDTKYYIFKYIYTYNSLVLYILYNK